MRDRGRERTAQCEVPGGDREVVFPAGAVIGGLCIEAAGAVVRRPGQPLVEIVTESGALVSPPDQAVWARRKAANPSGPYGEPEWVPAGRVRLGDWLCRPRRLGPDLWLQVTAISHQMTEKPLFRFETADESVLAYGFVTRANWRRP